jgi:hypothetical protein
MRLFYSSLGPGVYDLESEHEVSTYHVLMISYVFAITDI